MNPLPNILTMNRSKGIYLTWSIIRFQYNIQPTAFLNMAKDHWSYLALFHLTRIFFHLFCCVCIRGIPHPSRSKVVYCSLGLDWGKIGLRTKAGRCRIWTIFNLFHLKALLTSTYNLQVYEINLSLTLKSRGEAILKPDGLVPLQSPPLPTASIRISGVRNHLHLLQNQNTSQHWLARFSFLFPNMRQIPRARKNRKQLKTKPGRHGPSPSQCWRDSSWKSEAAPSQTVTRQESTNRESPNSAVPQVIKLILLFLLQFLARPCSPDSIIS